MGGTLEIVLLFLPIWLPAGFISWAFTLRALRKYLPSGRVKLLPIEKLVILPGELILYWCLAVLGFAVVFETPFDTNILDCLCYGPIAIVTTRLAIIDIWQHRLPNVFTYTLAAIAAPVAILTFDLQANDSPGGVGFWTRLALGLLPFGLLGVFSLLSRGGIGLGDVKLAFTLGLVSELLGAKAVILFLAISFILAGVGALLTLWLRTPKQSPNGQKVKTVIAFGPYLLAGFWISSMAVMLIP